MAEPKENVQTPTPGAGQMEKIVSLCKRRGFIFQSSEIYGGIQGFWDYGPLGAELKRNVKEAWWTTMIRQRDDVVGLEATIIMAPQIWRASGHVDTFSDPMCDCRLTGKRFRADQVEPQSGKVYYYSGAKDKTGRRISELLNKTSASLASGGAIPPAESDELIALLRQQVAGFEANRPFHSKEDARERVSTLVQSPDPETQRIGKALAEALDRDKETRPPVPESSAEPFAVLLPPGRPPESAWKLAVKFYERRGMQNPEPIEDRIEPVENSTRFNPENGAELTPPRQFNLMLKTTVGPVDVPPLDDDLANDRARLLDWRQIYREAQENVAYLRPETAQAIFAQFKNVLETSRQKVPFGIGQVGKAFRNEVTPRNFTFRSREFEQMELEFFIKPDEAVEAIHGSVAREGGLSSPPGGLENPPPQPNWGWQAWHTYWVEERVRFYEGIGLPRETLGFHRQTAEELAHYARACVDILFKFPFSKRDERGELIGEELEGIAARSDFDLSQHERFSGKPMGVFDEELRTAWGKLDDATKAALSKRYYEARLKYLTKMGMETAKAEKEAKEDADGLAKGQYIPHVIEPSAGVDRLILALICHAFTEVTETDEKGKSETRVIMKFHPRVAPIKVAVLPLLKNRPDLVAKARAVYASVRNEMNAFYDDAGSIGRRYARQDEAGTPYCVTIDFDTLGEKPELLNTVTIRHRDDGRQERLAISELPAWLIARVR